MTLRAVKPGSPAPRRGPAPQSVKSAAESGSHAKLLVALRSRIAADIDNPNTPPRDIAALSRRLLEISADLELLAASEKADDIGEAAATPDQEWASS